MKIRWHLPICITRWHLPICITRWPLGICITQMALAKRIGGEYITVGGLKTMVNGRLYNAMALSYLYNAMATDLSA